MIASPSGMRTGILARMGAGDVEVRGMVIPPSGIATAPMVDVAVVASGGSARMGAGDGKVPGMALPPSGIASALMVDVAAVASGGSTAGCLPVAPLLIAPGGESGSGKRRPIMDK